MKKTFKERYKEIVESPEHQTMLKRNKYEGKLRALYLLFFIPAAFLLAYLIEFIFHLDNKSPTWILGTMSILLAIILASKKAHTKFN